MKTRDLVLCVMSISAVCAGCEREYGHLPQDRVFIGMHKLKAYLVWSSHRDGTCLPDGGGQALGEYLNEAVRRSPYEKAFTLEVILSSPGIKAREETDRIVCRDYWGTEIRYRYLDGMPDTVFELRSFGPDRKDDAGGGDDIVVRLSQQEYESMIQRYSN